MKCQYCNSSWESFRQIEKCPFCGKDLTSEPLSFDEIQPALNYVVSKYGKEIYKAEKRCMSLLSDYTRGTESELRLLRICFGSGVVADVLAADEKSMAERKIMLQKAAAQLEDQYFIKQEMAVRALFWIAVSLGWPVKQRTTRSEPAAPGSDKKAAETVLQSQNQFNHTEQKSTPVPPVAFRAPAPRPPQQPPTRTDPAKRPFAAQTAPVQAPPVSRTTGRMPLKTGEMVHFGNYPQSYDGKSQSIEWIVLKTEANRALLLSKKALASRAYHERGVSVTWETCTLRRWLNVEFYDAAFSDKEKVLIGTADVINRNNPEHGTTGGRNTRDRVFLLSAEEVNKYFGNAHERECVKTARGGRDGFRQSTTGYQKTCWWWLRSPGSSSKNAARINGYGELFSNGLAVNNANGGVRPALWLCF